MRRKEIDLKSKMKERERTGRQIYDRQTDRVHY